MGDSVGGSGRKDEGERDRVSDGWPWQQQEGRDYHDKPSLIVERVAQDQRPHGPDPELCWDEFQISQRLAELRIDPQTTIDLLEAGEISYTKPMLDGLLRQGHQSLAH